MINKKKTNIHSIKVKKITAENGKKIDSSVKFLKKIDKLKDTEIFSLTKFILKQSGFNKNKQTSFTAGTANFKSYKQKDLNFFIYGVGVFNFTSLITKIYILFNILFTFYYYIGVVYTDYTFTGATLFTLIIKNFAGLSNIINFFLSFNFLNILQSIINSLFLSNRYKFLNHNSFFTTFKSNFITPSFISLLINSYTIFFYGGLLEYKIKTEKKKFFKYIKNEYLYFSLLSINIFLIVCIQHIFNKVIVFGTNNYGNSLLAISLFTIYTILFPNEIYLFIPESNSGNDKKDYFYNSINKVVSYIYNKYRLLDYFIYKNIFSTLLFFILRLLTFNFFPKTNHDNIITSLNSLHIVIIIFSLCFTIIVFKKIVNKNWEEKKYYISIDFGVNFIKRLLQISAIVVGGFFLVCGIYFLFKLDQLSMITNFFGKIRSEGIFLTFFRVIKLIYYIIFISLNLGYYGSITSA
jgi:hypothetical protein